MTDHTPPPADGDDIDALLSAYVADLRVGSDDAELLRATLAEIADERGADAPEIAADARARMSRLSVPTSVEGLTARARLSDAVGRLAEWTRHTINAVSAVWIPVGPGLATERSQSHGVVDQALDPDVADRNGVARSVNISIATTSVTMHLVRVDDAEPSQLLAYVVAGDDDFVAPFAIDETEAVAVVGFPAGTVIDAALVIEARPDD